LGEDGIICGGIVFISRLVVYVVICKVHLEGRVQHGVWYEVREVEPTADVKNRLVKFLDTGFMYSRAQRAAVPGTRRVMIACICTACDRSHFL
jgi:hypothetical protein